jgi:hypothetical protein
LPWRFSVDHHLAKLLACLQIPIRQWLRSEPQTDCREVYLDQIFYRSCRQGQCCLKRVQVRQSGGNLEQLSCWIKETRARETIAARVIELARRGERCPSVLRDRVLAEANAGTAC